MPELIMKDKQDMVAIGGHVIWHDNGAVLKAGFMDAEKRYFLFDPLAGGVVHEADKRFESGLQRFVSIFGKVAYRFCADGAHLPEPLHRFDEAVPENGRFMKYLLHEVIVNGGLASFRKPD